MKTIFQSENCWRIEKAHRAAFVIDGENYFRALHEALQKARRSIMIVGWDLHSELRLIRNGETAECPEELGKLLDFLAKRNPGLQIYVLSWDFAMIYAMEREFFPRYKLLWSTHKQVRFCLDGEHPVGASQHMKMVVIDDAVAFAGGLDLSKWRWDTSNHLPDDKRRVDPDGEAYPPFHDMQMLVDGPAAQALGELASERWQRAYGEAPLIDERIEIGDPWPESVTADFNDVEVAIARTWPRYRDYAEVREVERLYLDTIAAARKFIYIENQYLSSFRIGEALTARLQETDGPEVIIVQPKKTGGWLEQHTMDVLRGRILLKLREVDRHRRLQVYYPRISVDPEVDLMVHAKVMVIDDCFVRVGSSNLSNRSLGFDSECDLAIAAEEGSPESKAISAFRNGLLAEHLGTEIEQVAKAYHETGTLAGAIESLNKGERRLVTLDGAIPDEVDQWVPESELLDPEQPLEPEELFQYLIGPKQQLPVFKHMLNNVLLIAIFLVVGALWRWADLGEYSVFDTVEAAALWVQQQHYTFLLIPFLYIAGGLCFFPVTVLLIATVLLFGPWQGFLYALIGAELSAVSLFLIGRRLGRDKVSRLSGDVLNSLTRKFSESGLKSVIFFRIFPVASFSIVNLTAGVSKIRLYDFALGTMIGLLPALSVLVIMAYGISVAMRDSGSSYFVGLMIVIALFGVALFFFLGHLRKKYGKGVSSGSV